MSTFSGNTDIHDAVRSGELQGRTNVREWTDREAGQRKLGAVFEYKDENGNWVMYGHSDKQKDVTANYLNKEMKRVVGREMGRLTRANEIIKEAEARRQGKKYDGDLEAGYGIHIEKSPTGKQTLHVIPEGDRTEEVAGRYDFTTDGKVYVAGHDRTPTFSDEEKAAANLWIAVYFDSSQPVTIHTVQPAMSDACEVYRIRAGGVNVQYGDIHESRT